MSKLFISKELDMDEKETAIMAVLNGLQTNKQEHINISILGIGYELTGRWLDIRNGDRRLYNNIRSGLESLIKREIIIVESQCGDNYIICSEGLEVDTETERFVVIELWELQAIFREAQKPFCLFLFFVRLIGTLNAKTKEWHMSQDAMVETWGYGKGTINSYFEQLEKLGLIYVYRHKKRRADDTYMKLNNSYGRPIDAVSIRSAAQDYEDSVEAEEFVEKIDRRAIKQRYNAYCKGSKRYVGDPAAVEQLYKECEKYNKTLKVDPIIIEEDGKYKKSAGLDLSVFPAELRAKDIWGKPDHIDDYEKAV